jgi:hypothetical protein
MKNPADVETPQWLQQEPDIKRGNDFARLVVLSLGVQACLDMLKRIFCFCCFLLLKPI